MTTLLIISIWLNIGFVILHFVENDVRWAEWKKIASWGILWPVMGAYTWIITNISERD